MIARLQCNALNNLDGKATVFAHLRGGIDGMEAALCQDQRCRCGQYKRCAQGQCNQQFNQRKAAHPCLGWLGYHEAIVSA